MWAIVSIVVILYVVSFILFIRYLRDKSKKKFKAARLDLILLVVSFITIICLSYLVGIIPTPLITGMGAFMAIYWFYVLIFVILTVADS
jgi:hypothetical protein